MDAGDLLRGTRVMPVVVLEDPDLAIPLAQTLLSAGIGAIEVTLRSGAALQAIERIAAGCPDILLGAGSIRRPGQLREVAEAGARFAVSPGSSPNLLAAARQRKMPLVPGAVTASEMIVLLEAGYTLQKFFPAEPSGGLAAIRSLAAPLPEVRFFPTGGIDATRAADYLAHPAIACVGGSWFVPADALAARDFDRIGRLAAEAAALAAEP